MKNQIRVYLAGPIRWCSEEQRDWWRKEVKQRLRHLEFEDPVKWFKERVPQEISKLAACDIVLANMWKESIGTTVSILRARQQGKPVVLLDPNRLNHAILHTLVSPEKTLLDLDEACERVNELAEALAKPFRVRNAAGEETPFDPRRLAASVSETAAAAGQSDPVLAELISAPTIVELRQAGAQNGYVSTEDIRTSVRSRLDWVARSTSGALRVKSKR